jgi:hypothetical protein
VGTGLHHTVFQLIVAIRRAIRVVSGAAEVAGRWCTAYDYADPGTSEMAGTTRLPAKIWSMPGSRTR